MGKLLCRVFAIIVLALAVINFSVVLKNSPAFNSDERQRSVVGGWRVPNVASHYDKSEYQLELAYGYINELGLTYDPETGETGLIDPEEMNARTARALELIEQVIQLDPSNASAWTYRAQAEGRNNDIDAMRVSLEKSWTLAPHNLQLAPLRLLLVMILDQHITDTPETYAALSEDEIAAARRDGAVLGRNSPRYLAGLMERSEVMNKLLADIMPAENTSS